MKRNRYMPKPYRCNLCFRAFDTFDLAHTHWFDVHAQTTLATEIRAAKADAPTPPRSTPIGER